MNDDYKTNQTRIDIDNPAGYDRWSDFYDSYPNPTIAADDDAFPAFWGALRDLDILEIGCGTGRHTMRLAAHNCVTGVDVSAGMLAMARTKLPHSVHLIEADFVTYAGFANASFDVALTSLVLEHISDLNGFFARLAAVLRPSGHFFMSEIHPARTADGIFAHFRDGDSEYHLTSYPHTQETITAAAASAELKVTRQQDITGNDTLAARNPKWTKYQGQPMIRMWDFERK